ncbi:hypothetical protein GCM10008107_16520 [Psychrosphaera saromensis]|uniref:GmrSD restriction endonucleases N-terminal domain-containing protein n=1 Tax=Psychrosphaera saromensis TaxID=716813 RepID=A0A2S7UT22_9GAMM|nr:DUF262 domain-containing protein [Psychrosphaera saromensis]PQJ53136.1 hypothetical protein BTO11_05305 [Psychrosphaera saromensis]GHB67761.1 hypothetical protein GCM10008107_16520 [Psychrosphaera saromensis]GLQ15108.1 hypothetical protein GCM10007917_25630 [Psychrosphaera saromensis]
MSSGKSLTFYGLFDEVDSIEIPILQRDYAQGRSEESEVRTLFLRSLFNVLTVEDDPERHPLDLDFVYGNFENGDNKIFSVLDGQQRLTTLFLLHWFLAVENNQQSDFKERFVTSDSRSRFTYKTRPSTTEFFNALMANNFVSSKRKLSVQISDSQWFYLSWKQDPTVQACLCMLDAIQEMFVGKSDGLFDKLSDTAHPYITFQFLNLHSFGLSDELYIKMNARGKPLTVFENFKAKLEQFIQSYDQQWPDYQLVFREGQVDGFDYFIHKIDTSWADLFWPYRNTYSDDNTFDDELMNFFRLIIAYQYLLDNKNSPVLLAKAKSDIFGLSGRLQAPTLSKYEELKCFNQNLIIRLIDMLDLIYNDGLVGNQISPYLEDQYYYSEEKTFKKVIWNSASYDDKLRFYAFYTYVAKNKDKGQLSSWMRVIYNLVENTIINTADEFYKALFAINELSQFDTSILVTFKGELELTGFVGAQVLEEKIKAHLLLKSPEWSNAVVGAEKHPFFNGQIGFILNFSGILAFYREHKHCDWTEELDVQYFSKFGQYAKSASAVFNLIKYSSSTIDYSWERAVLSKGIYFTEKTGGRYNLLSTRETRNNINRDHSWRRLLRIGSAAMEEKQKYVKAVLDDSLFDPKNVATSLMLICNDALENSDIEDWRKALIKYKALISYCSQGFISLAKEEIILLSESQRNHYHSELYTKVIEQELALDQEQIKPFCRLSYQAVKSREEYANVLIDNWLFNGNDYSITIEFYSGSFLIWFRGRNSSRFSDSISEVLTNHDFELVNTGSKGSTVNGNRVNKKLSHTSDVIKKIFNLCLDLQKLTCDPIK